MNELELSVIFEQWHSQTRQFKKYNLSHTKRVQPDGSVIYCDNRTNWAYIAFKGGWNEANKASL